MRKTQKQILFFGLLLFFSLSSFIFIFYSQGYRFDFARKKIVQTGGLFLKVSPPGASIYLNDKLIKKTNFLFDSLFLNNLLPQKYKIQIKKEGYHSWEKTLPVEELKVTEAKNILLFPKKIDFKNLETNIQKFFALPRTNNLILQKSEKDSWEIAGLDPDLKEKILAKEDDFINFFSTEKTKKNPSIEIENLIPSNNGSFLLQLSSPDKKKLFLFDWQLNQIKEIKLKKIQIKEIKLDPANPNRVFILGKDTTKKESPLELFLAQTDQKNPKKIKFTLGIEPITFNFLNDNLLLLTKDGFLLKGRITNNYEFQVLEFLNLKPKKINQEKEYKLRVLNDFIFLYEGESLFYFDPSLHIFLPVLEIAKDFSLSPDNKKIAISTGNQIWLFYLKNNYHQPQRFRLEKFLLTTSKESINNILWLNPYYLIIASKDGIKIAEIDNRSNLNETIISEFKDPKIFWDPNKKRLFAFSQNSLFFVDKILK